jgi:hypothetical protein
MRAVVLWLCPPDFCMNDGCPYSINLLSCNIRCNDCISQYLCIFLFDIILLKVRQEELKLPKGFTSFCREVPSAYFSCTWVSYIITLLCLYLKIKYSLRKGIWLLNC